MGISVVVFGGNGFIGSFVCQELIQRNYKVYVADLDDSNLPEGIQFLKCDITKQQEIDNVFKSKPDFVFNFAGKSELDQAIKTPYQTFELNVLANIYILKQCVEYNVKHFVYASSAYASSDKGSFYGISKLTSEKIIEEFNKQYGLTYTNLRYGSIYSEKYFPNNYMYNLIKSALESRQIEHSTDGTEIREYVHASDAASMTVDVIEKIHLQNQSFILTGIEQIKRIDLFKMIKEISRLNIDIRINRESESKYHYKRSPYTFSPSKCKKLIANPQTDLGQGILSVIEEIMSHE